MSKQTLSLETVQYSTLCSGEAVQSTFFLKMMAINLTKVFKFKGQFSEHKSTIINIGIRGYKEKEAFKLKGVQTV